MANPELAFKCRRCRHYLFGGDRVLTGTDSDPTDAHYQGSVWYLKEEATPEWIQDAIDEAQWTKGKLNCPKCQGRLGSFDFITPNKTQMSGSIFTPIQVISTRVDCESSSPLINRIQQNNRRTDQHDATLFQDSTGGSLESQSSAGTSLSADQSSRVISSFAEATASFTQDSDSRENLRPEDLRNEALRCVPEIGEELLEQGNELERSTNQNLYIPQEFKGFNERRTVESEQRTGYAKDMVIRRRLQSGTSSSVDEKGTIHPSGKNGQSPQTTNQTGVQCRDTCNASSNMSNQTGNCVNTVRSERDDPLTMLPSSQGANNGNLETLSRDDPLNILPNPQGANSGNLETMSASNGNLETMSLDRQVEMDSSEVVDGIQFIGTSFDGENSASWEDFFEEIIQEMQDMRPSSDSADHDNSGLGENLSTSQDLNPNEIGGRPPVSANRLRARERAALRRERNKRKKEKRKQRRKEKWKECQDGAANFDEQEADLASLVDVLGTDWSRQALLEVTTCSICLDVFFQPYSCVPCNHIFCEPCLRQLASVHPVVAPCPLCRASIQTVVEHYELTAAIKKLFPTQVQRRRQAERRTLHRSFPLPGHSSLGPISRPWFNIPRFRNSNSNNERVYQFTSRVNHVRQRRQELRRTFIQEFSSETVATLFFFAIFVGVVIAFLSLMQEFA